MCFKDPFFSLHYASEIRDLKEFSYFKRKMSMVFLSNRMQDAHSRSKKKKTPHGLFLNTDKLEFKV